MFNDQARSLFKRQYAIDENETLEQGMWRATEPLAHNDVARMLVYEAIMDKRFIPGGRIIAGAGTEHRNTINCYVLGSDTGKYDTLEEVRQLVIKVARTTKVGGGIGINFDRFATAQFSSKPRLQVIHYMNAEHPDADQFIKWQYRDITLPEGYQMKQHVKRSTARHSINPDDCVGATVIKVGDDIESIFNAAFEAAKIEGPVVLDWSALRPEGSPIKGSGGTSSGAASFAIEVDNILHWIELGGISAGPVAALRYVFNPVLRSVRQGGTRRGAGMATLSINNLDRQLFLNCKDLEIEARLGSIECFNISFLVGDKDVHSPFMEQVATHAWKSGEPGVIFVDAMNRGNPLLKHDGPILSTNPCGEVPLYRGEACDLGHIVLTGYVKDGKFDFETFSEDVMYYTMFLDANLDYAKFPTDDATRMARRNRRLGLGITGLAHTLIQLGIQYGSEYSLEFIRNIIHIMAEFSAQTSRVLAEELGFPEFNLHAEGIEKRRNIATLTIAPTGTTSMIVDTSSGIEPLFSIVIYRKVGGEYIKLLDPLFFDMLSKYDPPTDMGWSQDGKSGWNVDKCIDSIAGNHGSLKGLGWVPSQLRFLFVTTHDLEFTDHIKIQATAQVAMNHKNVGNSISKTINLRNEATASDILSAYRMAHELGCKGITVYRDGSRQLQVLNTSEDAQRLAEQYAQECANGSCEVNYE